MSTFASEYEALMAETGALEEEILPKSTLVERAKGLIGRMQEEMHTLDGRFQKVKNRALALQAFIEKNTLEGQGKSDSPFC